MCSDYNAKEGDILKVFIMVFHWFFEKRTWRSEWRWGWI